MTAEKKKINKILEAKKKAAGDKKLIRK